MIEYTLSDGICTLRLHNPPQNVISFDLLEALGKGIERANVDSDVRAIIVTGRADHFSAGVDVNILHDEICSSAEAVHMSHVFQDAFAKLESSSKPVVAALAGRIMGGALELAMACHFRVCTHGTKLSMPEVQLAINPGAGGTQRLPRLIGVDAALHMLLTAKPITANQALEWGLVDALCVPDELLNAAAGLATSGGCPVRSSERVDKVSNSADNTAAFAAAEKTIASGRDEIIAPKIMLNAVRVGLENSFEAGLEQEQIGFAQCIDTPAPHNKLHLFFATRKTHKIPELQALTPKQIQTAAVVGMGSMGTGIAQALAAAGVSVHMLDTKEQAAELAMGRIHQSLARQVIRGRRTEQQMQDLIGRLSVAKTWSDIAPADLIVEAVFEKMGPKRSVLTEIEAVCPRDAIIASNTSTLDLDQLAETLTDPQRLIGLHFFNPAQAMPLVEVVQAARSTPDVMATALHLVKAIAKTPVLVKNSTGFIVNRLFIPYLKEAFQLLEDGAEAGAIDAAMRKFGFSMGPLTLIDMAGLDILVLTDAPMCQAFSHHMPVSRIARDLVEQGCLGQKSGAGVYSYEKGDYTPREHDLTQDITTRVQAELGKTVRAIDPEEITDRLVLRMVSEAFRVLEEGVAQRASDIDVAMVLGTGFPDFRGGVLKYARDTGVDKIIYRLDALAASCGERFRPCKSMRTKG
jgi:3-hydroxyacyl-CoA dehydrogenase